MKTEKKSPDGMICRVCNRDLPLVHFYRHLRGKEDYLPNTGYFVSEYSLARSNDVCFECASPYRCVECGEIKPAAEYRLQGRMCKACKSKRRKPARMR